MTTSDLLSDLQVDRHRTRPAPRREPALELRITPLHWSAPRLAVAGERWSVRLGPLQAALALR